MFKTFVSVFSGHALYDNEVLDSIKGGKFLDELNNY
jgi:hypothetical protein